MITKQHRAPVTRSDWRLLPPSHQALGRADAGRGLPAAPGRSLPPRLGSGREGGVQEDSGGQLPLQVLPASAADTEAAGRAAPCACKCSRLPGLLAAFSSQRARYFCQLSCGAWAIACCLFWVPASQSPAIPPPRFLGLRAPGCLQVTDADRVPCAVKGYGAPASVCDYFSSNISLESIITRNEMHLFKYSEF